MRKKLSFYIIFGVASTAIIWSVQEFLLFVLSNFSLPQKVITVLLGAVTGVLLGSFLSFMDGFFSGSKFLFRKGLKIGALFGLLSGLISFYIIGEVSDRTSLPELEPYFSIALFSARWLIVMLCIGIAVGIREKSQTAMTRGVICGLVSGLFGGVIASSLYLAIPFPFLVRGIGLLVIVLVFIVCNGRVSDLGRKTWLKALNGKLEGLEIELSRDIHVFGTQDNDDINLHDYQDVQQSHAKMIRYFDNYSLIDNDPFCQTFVNFRGIKEQFLKNGDILKIGTALFQYCTLD